MMTLDQAARALREDLRRATAARVTDIISQCATEVMTQRKKYNVVFNSGHAVVSGSTARDTHLPDASDFDIGLVPSRLDVRVKDTPETLGALVMYFLDLCRNLSLSKSLVDDLASLRDAKPDKVMEVLRKDIEVDSHYDDPDDFDLITARLKFKDKTLLEVSAGIDPCHQEGVLYYNERWRQQLNNLGSEERKQQVLDCVRLLKILTRDYVGGYGYKFGAPSARGLEQLILGHGLNTSPLEDSGRTVLELEQEPNRITPFLTLQGSARCLGLPEGEDLVLVNFDMGSEGWKRFRQLARDILDNKVAWEDHLNRHGVAIKGQG